MFSDLISKEVSFPDDYLIYTAQAMNELSISDSDPRMLSLLTNARVYGDFWMHNIDSEWGLFLQSNSNTCLSPISARKGKHCSCIGTDMAEVMRCTIRNETLEQSMA